jgi:hypothetical protein
MVKGFDMICFDMIDVLIYSIFHSSFAHKSDKNRMTRKASSHFSALHLMLQLSLKESRLSGYDASIVQTDGF